MKFNFFSPGTVVQDSCVVIRLMSGKVEFLLVASVCVLTLQILFIEDLLDNQGSE